MSSLRIVGLNILKNWKPHTFRCQNDLKPVELLNSNHGSHSRHKTGIITLSMVKKLQEPNSEKEVVSILYLPNCSNYSDVEWDMDDGMKKIKAARMRLQGSKEIETTSV